MHFWPKTFRHEKKCICGIKYIKVYALLTINEVSLERVAQLCFYQILCFVGQVTFLCFSVNLSVTSGAVKNGNFPRWLVTAIQPFFAVK